MSGTASESLAEQAAEEMANRWRNGERPRSEEFFRRYPQLEHDAQAAAELIFEEISLRQECGDDVSSHEILNRFPQWRDQLRVLLDCYRVLVPGGGRVRFPPVHTTLGSFRLIGELSRSARCCVYLATQPRLAHRPVVLKVTPGGGRESGTLARLQHTHIMPLYCVEEFEEGALRGLCMPYFGGATLARILQELRDCPVAQRSGRQILTVLDAMQLESPLKLSSRGHVWQFLAHSSYIDAITAIGACLADALHYAHERELVHLDLKPSNVLLTFEGHPMLLDFHLARAPIAALSPEERSRLTAQPVVTSFDSSTRPESSSARPGLPSPDWLGGTLEYMSPEQRAAFDTVRSGGAVSVSVDGRSDVYSLGLVLYEALGGPVPLPKDPPRLDRCNREVSTGLADLIARCLAHDPANRYPTAAALAEDLRRHLAHLPLEGVSNRSWAERWHKWRLRRPHALAMTTMLFAVVGAAIAVAIVTKANLDQRRDQARQELTDGRQLLSKREFSEAATMLKHALSVAQTIPGDRVLSREIGTQLRDAERSVLAADLDSLVNQARFLFADNSLAPADLQALELRCRAVWDKRDVILKRLESGLEPEAQNKLHANLLDLSLLWTGLNVRLAGQESDSENLDAARRHAIEVLDQAEALFGPSAVLSLERQYYAAALGLGDMARDAERRAKELEPRNGWEHYALGRSLMQKGDLERAARSLDAAVALDPQGLWTNFYQGICAYRLGRREDAVIAFTACIGVAPDSAKCLYNRAVAYAALGCLDRALADYDRALKLDPVFVDALVNRGMVFYRAGRLPEASADLQKALSLGANTTTLYYDLALIFLAQGDRAAARSALDKTIELDPMHQAARELLDRLRQ